MKKRRLLPAVESLNAVGEKSASRRVRISYRPPHMKHTIPRDMRHIAVGDDPDRHDNESRDQGTCVLTALDRGISES
jgi:hypothetical protein